MSERKEKELSRREFMRLAVAVGSTVAVAGRGYGVNKDIPSDLSQADSLLRLNPAFRIKEISEEKIELYTNMTGGKFLKYPFEGLEADLFRGIEKEKEINPLITELAKKHNLTQDECQEKIQTLVKEFEGAKLIYYGEKMKVKLVENIYE